MKVKGWKFGKPKFGFKSKITKKVRKIISCKEEEAIVDFIIQRVSTIGCYISMLSIFVCNCTSNLYVYHNRHL